MLSTPVTSLPKISNRKKCNRKNSNVGNRVGFTISVPSICFLIRILASTFFCDVNFSLQTPGESAMYAMSLPAYASYLVTHVPDWLTGIDAERFLSVWRMHIAGMQWVWLPFTLCNCL